MFNKNLLPFFIYKVFSLIAGLISIYWGYNLFMKNISAKAGDLHASNKDVSLSLKEAAPGTFFCVFGAIIILITVLKGFRQTNKNNGDDIVASPPDDYPAI